jgi:NDP-sugar pyrophosphorylase family protein
VFEVMTPEGPEDINHDVYPRLFGEDGVRGTVLAAPWSDLGSAETYLEAQADLLLGRVPDPLGADSPLAGRPRGDPLVEQGARVHASAHVAPDVFVAADVEVPAGAHIRAAALLPGAVVGSAEAVTSEIRWEGKRLHGRSALELAGPMAEALNLLAFVAQAQQPLETPSAELAREVLGSVRTLQDFIGRIDRSSDAARRLIGASAQLEELSAAVEARAQSLDDIRARARAFLLAAGFAPAA